MTKRHFEETTAKFFNSTVKLHGANAKGLDYNTNYQHIGRLDVLVDLAVSNGLTQNASIIDFGCGFGSLINVLHKSNLNCENYFGIDLSYEMIALAKSKWANLPNANFEVGGIENVSKADFIFCSGVFNKKLQHSSDSWQAYVLENISRLFDSANHALVFNMLTDMSDENLHRDDLYYANPIKMMAHCFNLTKKIELKHNYGLYDFSICMVKDEKQ